MAFRTDTPATVDATTGVVERREAAVQTAWWSPAQIVALLIGIGFVVLGVAVVAKTGFDTGHIYRPQDLVWHLPHSPLLGVIEIGYGAVMIIAGVVPGGLRSLIVLLGAAALAFGIAIIVQSLPNRLNHWLAVTHRSGWFFVVVGAVAALSGIFLPTFGGTFRRRVVVEDSNTRALA